MQLPPQMLLLQLDDDDPPPEPVAPPAIVSSSSSAALEELLEDFRCYQLPSSPQPSQSRAAGERARHARKFCLYMASGVHPPPGHLAYLKDWARFGAWFQQLNRSFAPTTIANYVINCVRFMTYLKEMRPPGLGLTTYEVEQVIHKLHVEREAMKEPLAEHRFRVLNAKSERLIGGPEMLKFMAAARRLIPAALAALRENPAWDRAATSCVGLMVAYLATLSGLRKGCFLFMSAADVTEAPAAPGADDGARVLTLGRHKTQRVYGPAKMLLNKEEHGWLLQYARLRPHMPGFSEQTDTMFFNNKGRPMEKLGSHVKRAYLKVTNRAGVTMTAIRSAVATLAARRLSVDEQSTLGRSMGHSLQTRDRFYVALEDGCQLRAKRSLFEKALDPPDDEAPEQEPTADPPAEQQPADPPAEQQPNDPPAEQQPNNPPSPPPTPTPTAPEPEEEEPGPSGAAPRRSHRREVLIRQAARDQLRVTLRR